MYQELFECLTRAEILSFSAVWDQLAALQMQYVASFSDLHEYLEDPSVETRLIGARDRHGVTALAIFLIYDRVQTFWLGEKPVVRVPTRGATLFGSASLGTADATVATAMLKRIAADRSIDMISFADIPQSDYFYEAVVSGAWHGPVNISRHRTTRRLAQLPPTMDEYWATLRPTTRKAGLRDLKMFDKLGPTYRVFATPEEASEFLERAASLSAVTYQQKLGFGVEDTPRTRQNFVRLASEGRFRGYLASIDGADVAYAWGDISHDAFYFRTTGYDQALAKYSPGKAILFAMMRDLIDQQVVRTFDFSGRDMDFKERFSTTAMPCANFVIARWSKPRGIIAVALDKTLDASRTIAPRLLGADRVERLRRALRR